MTRTAVIGMTLIVFALAGCTDNREIKALKNTDASLSDEIAFLNTRVNAVEEACLQLNTRIMAAETRDRTPELTATAKPDSSRPAAQDKNDSVPLKSVLDARPTRSSFSHRAVGMTVTETLAMFGKPDNVSEESGTQNWIYNGLILDMEGGGVEQSPALIVFEQGCVSRAVLTRFARSARSARSEASERGEASEQAEKTQYSSQPKESKTSNTVVQTNQ